jgi:hypothetical protein
LFLVLLDGFAHSHHREDDFLVVNCCHVVRVSFFDSFVQRYEEYWEKQKK